MSFLLKMPIQVDQCSGRLMLWKCIFSSFWYSLFLISSCSLHLASRWVLVSLVSLCLCFKQYSHHGFSYLGFLPCVFFIHHGAIGLWLVAINCFAVIIPL
jgi:hypothetical protein